MLPTPACQTPTAIKIAKKLYLKLEGESRRMNSGVCIIMLGGDKRGNYNLSDSDGRCIWIWYDRWIGALIFYSCVVLCVWRWFVDSLHLILWCDVVKESALYNLRMWWMILDMRMCAYKYDNIPSVVCRTIPNVFKTLTDIFVCMRIKDTQIKWVCKCQSVVQSQMSLRMFQTFESVCVSKTRTLQMIL